ncbi:hypothetical protein T31B1_01615 [Salinisphaera sp. T31B1]
MNVPDFLAKWDRDFAKPIRLIFGCQLQYAEIQATQLPNAEAQLTPEQAKPAEGTRSAPALWAVNCSDLLGDLYAAANFGFTSNLEIHRICNKTKRMCFLVERLS